MITPEPLPPLTDAERRWLLWAARTVMVADGRIDAAEESVLDQLAGLLDLDPTASADPVGPITPEPPAHPFMLGLLHFMAQADRVVDSSEVKVLRELTSGWRLRVEEHFTAAATAQRWIQERRKLSDLFTARLPAA